jgi:hypothetical protein
VSSNADADDGADPDFAVTYSRNPIIRIGPNDTWTPAPLDAVSIACTNARDLGGTPLPGALSVAERIVQVNTSFGVAVTTAATSVIDVNNGRVQFVEEGGVGDVLTTANDTDLLASAALITFSQVDLDEDILLDGNDSWTLTLDSSTDFTGVSFANADDTMMETGGDGGNDDADSEFADTTYDVVIPGNTVNMGNGALVANADDLVIGIDGTTVIAPRTFTLTVDLEFDAADGYTDCQFGPLNTHALSINGRQYYSPHNIGRNGIQTYLVFKTTAAAIASEITMDLVFRDGSTASIDSGDLAKLALPAGAAGGFVSITANEIQAAAGKTVGDSINNDFSAIVTVTLPENSIFIEGLKYAGGVFGAMSIYEWNRYNDSAADFRWEE